MIMVHPSFQGRMKLFRYVAENEVGISLFDRACEKKKQGALPEEKKPLPEPDPVPKFTPEKPSIPPPEERAKPTQEERGNLPPEERAKPQPEKPVQPEAEKPMPRQEEKPIVDIKDECK